MVGNRGIASGGEKRSVGIVEFAVAISRIPRIILIAPGKSSAVIKIKIVFSSRKVKLKIILRVV